MGKIHNQAAKTMNGINYLKITETNSQVSVPIKELVLGLNVGDIEAPLTAETLAYLSEMVSPMSPNVKSFLVEFHKIF